MVLQRKARAGGRIFTSTQSLDVYAVRINGSGATTPLDDGGHQIDVRHQLLGSMGSGKTAGWADQQRYLHQLFIQCGALEQQTMASQHLAVVRGEYQQRVFQLEV